MISSLALALAVSLPQAPQDFPTPRVIAEATDGEFRAHGDFDHDGDVDLLHFRGSVLDWTGVRVFENVGDGDFVPGPETLFHFPASYTSGRLQPFVGDFDGDSNLDFVIARDGAGAALGEGLEFFFGDGSLGWSSRALLPMATPRWIAIGDIDGDAALEVAVSHIDASYQNMLSWVDVQGGVPIALPPYVLTAGVAPTVIVFDVVDVDGDGLDDIAATATAGSVVDRVQFFPTVAGTPTLGSYFTLPVQLQNINHRLLAGDLDGDGDGDLLFLKMELSDPGPWVQPLERIAGGWVQRPAQSITTPTTGWFQPHDTQLIDWDGDGWLDVITGGQQNDMLRAVGSWQFTRAFHVAGTGQAAGGGAFDHDGDGYLDYVGGYSVLQGDGTFQVESAVNLPLFTDLIADREGDGDPDLTSGGPGWLARNDGTGAFALTSRAFPPLGANEHYATPIAYADFDGDGRPEFLTQYFYQVFPPFSAVTQLGMLRITDDRRDQFEPGVPATANPADVIAPPTTSANDARWSTGDVDGDGDLDLLLVGGYRENDGTGMLATFVGGYLGRGRQVGDVDGDGVPDVLTTAFNGVSTMVSIYLGVAGGGFTAMPVTIAPGSADALLRDLDGDLDLDLMVASPGAPGMTLFENVLGTFVLRTTLPDAVAGWLRFVGTRDLDGDGVQDLLVVSRHATTIGNTVDTLTRYHGTGSHLGYTLASEHLAPFNVSGFADLDGDGDLDAIGGAMLRGCSAPSGSGAVRQYGVGTGGAAGVLPLLGARGPIVSTSTADELRIVRGWPGASALLVFGLVETSIPDAPLNGLVLHVGDPIVLLLPQLVGTPGVAGTGELTITLPDLPFLAGFTIVHQVFLEDPTAVSGWASSNGLALTYGN